MAMTDMGLAMRNWHPGIGYRAVAGLGAWSGPGADPGSPYTREKLRVPVLTLSNYREHYPNWAGDPPAQSDLDSIMDQIHRYRLCWWAGICGPGEGPLGDWGAATPEVTVVPGVFIEDTYPLGDTAETHGTGVQWSGAGWGLQTPTPQYTTGPSQEDLARQSRAMREQAESLPSLPSPGGVPGYQPSAGAAPPLTGTTPEGVATVAGIPVLWLALGAGALFLMTQGKGRRF